MEQGELQQDSRHCSPKCAKAVLSECGECMCLPPCLEGVGVVWESSLEYTEQLKKNNLL